MAISGAERESFLMSEEKQLVNPDQESLPEIEKIDELLAQSLPDVSEVARKEIHGIECRLNILRDLLKRQTPFT